MGILNVGGRMHLLNKATLGIIGGSGASDIPFVDWKENLKMSTEYGEGYVKIGDYKNKKIAFIMRHSKGVPPHKINHALNLSIMKHFDIKCVIGICSVGALSDKLKVPSILIPHDYIDFFSTATIFSDRCIHILPSFSERIREKLIEKGREVCEIPFYDEGIYFQTRGPRLETKSEIQFISKFADVVGMTGGSEATISKEMEIEYAIICTVDNYAHGIKGYHPDYKEIKKRAEISLSNVCEIIKKYLEDG